VGLNIDFKGAHASARPLLQAARVAERCHLVRADALHMPFPDDHFASSSCFLGLQDIHIGFGDNGVRTALCEVLRVTQRGGVIALFDEFQWSEFLSYIPSDCEIMCQDACTLDVRWDRALAEYAITLYARGWVEQMRLRDDRVARERAYQERLTQMRHEMETQLKERGYFSPFDPIRMVLLRKEQ